MWVVFNGEIYNFPELRQELEARGHHFYTHSDTEVIVHLYEEMGSDCVQKLRGMFAIALWDERKQLLLLARDRMGKKPLHYARHAGRLLFGSEIKALLAVDPELAEINPEGLLQYFYFGYIPDPHSAFRRIHKLPAGHLMEYCQGEVKIRRYWDLPEYGTHPAMSEEECLDELERQLEEVVRIRLISDVPLGNPCCLLASPAISDTCRRDPATIKAAKTATENEFREHLNRDHGQHIERPETLKFTYPAPDAAQIKAYLRWVAEKAELADLDDYASALLFLAIHENQERDA